MSGGPDLRMRDGREAEEAACRFLEGTGMTILARNVRAGGGEIDVVGRMGRTLVFVEVRSRATDAFGRPEETVDRGKRMRVVRAARAYVAAVPAGSWSDVRFDVVAVEGPEGARTVRHYPGAFDARGKIL